MNQNIITELETVFRTKPKELIYMFSEALEILDRNTANYMIDEMTQEMKEQAYYSEEEDLYFFNVTEEQYHELTEDFFEANDISEEKLKTIGYTYDELFGNGTLCETCNSNKAIYL